MSPIKQLSTRTKIPETPRSADTPRRHQDILQHSCPVLCQILILRGARVCRILLLWFRVIWLATTHKGTFTKIIANDNLTYYMPMVVYVGMCRIAHEVSSLHRIYVVELWNYVVTLLKFRVVDLVLPHH